MALYLGLAVPIHAQEVPAPQVRIGGIIRTARGYSAVVCGKNASFLVTAPSKLGDYSVVEIRANQVVFGFRQNLWGFNLQPANSKQLLKLPSTASPTDGTDSVDIHFRDLEYAHGALWLMNDLGGWVCPEMSRRRIDIEATKCSLEKALKSMAELDDLQLFKYRGLNLILTSKQRTLLELMAPLPSLRSSCQVSFWDTDLIYALNQVAVENKLSFIAPGHLEGSVSLVCTNPTPVRDVIPLICLSSFIPVGAYSQGALVVVSEWMDPFPTLPASPVMTLTPAPAYESVPVRDVLEEAAQACHRQLDLPADLAQKRVFIRLDGMESLKVAERVASVFGYGMHIEANRLSFRSRKTEVAATASGLPQSAIDGALCGAALGRVA